MFLPTLKMLDFVLYEFGLPLKYNFFYFLIYQNGYILKKYGQYQEHNKELDSFCMH